jgi:hypothetical protein
MLQRIRFIINKKDLKSRLVINLNLILFHATFLNLKFLPLTRIPMASTMTTFDYMALNRKDYKCLKLRHKKTTNTIREVRSELPHFVVTSHLTWKDPRILIINQKFVFVYILVLHEHSPRIKGGIFR